MIFIISAKALKTTASHLYQKSFSDTATYNSGITVCKFQQVKLGPPVHIIWITTLDLRRKQSHEENHQSAGSTIDLLLAYGRVLVGLCLDGLLLKQNCPSSASVRNSLLK